MSLRDAENHVLRGGRSILELREAPVERQWLSLFVGEVGEIRVADGQGAEVRRRIFSRTIANQMRQQLDSFRRAGLSHGDADVSFGADAHRPAIRSFCSGKKDSQRLAGKRVAGRCQVVTE